MNIHETAKQLGDNYRLLVNGMIAVSRHMKEQKFARRNAEAVLLLHALPSDLVRAVVDEVFGEGVKT